MISIRVVGVGSFGERAAAAAKVSNGKLLGADLSLEGARDIAQRVGVTAFTLEELNGGNKTHGKI